MVECIMIGGYLLAILTGVVTILAIPFIAGDLQLFPVVISIIVITIYFNVFIDLMIATFFLSIVWLILRFIVYYLRNMQK